MSEQQVFENMQALRLSGMRIALQRVLETPELAAMSVIDILAFLTCEEIQYKSQKKRERLLKLAKLKQAQACVENIDHVAKRGIDKSHLSALCRGDWIVRNQFLLITGPTGVGKSWIACALANEAIKQNMSVLYKRFGLLMEELDIARRDGSLPKLRSQLSKFKLLVLDDWAMAPLTATGRHELLELVEERCGQGALVITSQLPVAQWHDYIGEPTVADAIMDRLIHRSHRLELHGGSLRKTYSKAEGQRDE